jgi:hypothetical protein
MHYDILLTQVAGNGYVARPLLWPELIVSGSSEADVLTRVRAVLVESMANSRIVQIEAPTELTSTEDPWVRFAGIWANTPADEWQQYLADVEAARQAMNQQDSVSDALHS